MQTQKEQWEDERRKLTVERNRCAHHVEAQEGMGGEALPPQLRG